MDSEYLEVWLLSGLTPKTLKFAENQDTARKYWEQIFKEDGAKWDAADNFKFRRGK